MLLFAPVCSDTKMPFSQVVDKDSEEAKIIRKYVKNTHATTHNAYDLKVLEVRLPLPLCRLFLLLLPAWAWVETSS